MSNDTKNNKIKLAIKATREKHDNMTCKVFELKLNSRKMSKQLTTYFREAKWRRNSIIANFENAARNSKIALVKVGDNFEERQFTILGSQVIQDIYDNVKSEIKGLHTKKQKGEKVGKLKFKSYCNCIPLRQYGTTYRIDIIHKLVRIQNINKWFRVYGLEQIPDNADLTNAKLIRKASGFYLNITCFIPKMRQKRNGQLTGIDFGIGHNLTMDNGKTFDVCVKESKGVKLASKNLNKSYKRNGKTKTNNHYRRVKKLRVAYEKDVNKRQDKANKIIHEILSTSDFIAIQDEMIHNWHAGLFGEQVQHSAMGYIKAKLMKDLRTHVVERSYPSTQICPVCGKKTKHPLNKRDYDCQYCGWHHKSRDQKSAQSILKRALYEIQVSPEQRAKSLVEVCSSALVPLDTMCKSSPMKQEAQVL